MDYKEFKFKLDMNRYNRLNIQPVQGESAVKLIPTLVHNSQPYNLMDSEVRCLFRKPDGTVSYIDGVILDADKGEIEFKLTNQVLLHSGSVVGLIDVTGTIGIARTWMFTMDVQPGILISDVISIDEFPAVEQMLIDVADIKSNFNAIVAGVTLDGEVILSRGVFDTLQERLDYIDENKANQSEVNAILTSLDEIVTDFTTDLNTLETQDILLAGQINNLVETTKPLVPDVKVSTYKPVTTLSPNAQEGQMNVKVLGQTLKNEIVNGDFRDGTTGWSASASSLSVLNKILSVTGNGSSTFPAFEKSTDIPMVTGKKVFIKAKMKITTTSCQNLAFYTFGDVVAGTAQSVVTMITNPVQNQLYNLLGIVTIPSNASGKLKIKAYHSYADNATANGKVMEVQDVIAVDMGTDSTNPLYNKTQAEMDEMVQHYFDGLSSVQAGTVKTVGKNLFDGNRAMKKAYIKLSDGLVSLSGDWVASDFIRVKPNTYYLSNIGGQSSLVASVAFYNDNKDYISGITNPTTAPLAFITLSTAKYIRVSYKLTGESTDTFQLEEGTTATPYEPYQETVYSLPEVKLHSLPNGIRDVIEGNRLVRIVQEYVLKASDIYALTTSGTNIDIPRVKLPNDIVKMTNTSASLGTVLIPNISKWVTLTGTTWDVLSSVGAIGTSDVLPSDIAIYVAKGTYTTLLQAQTALAGTKILYQLAEPVITELPPMTLKSNPKGSVIYLNSKKVISSYTTKAETTVPIKTITKITKVLTDGTRIPVSVNIGIVIATDKLSFTHSSLVNGDNIEWEYDFDSSISTSPLIEYGYENSKGEFPARNMVVNGDFSKGTDGWTATGGILTVASNKAKVTGNGTFAFGYLNQIIGVFEPTRKYYYKIRARVTNALATNLNLTLTPGTSGTIKYHYVNNGLSPISNEWYNISGVLTQTDETGNINIRVRANYPDTTIANGKELESEFLSVINLTETFGAGNEPTKEQMDKIMELHGGWFDGTANPLINARDMYKLLVKNVDSSWLTPTLIGGATISGTSVIGYNKDQFDTVSLRGKIVAPLDVSIMTLPIGYRPPETISFIVATLNNTTFIRCQIDQNGGVKIYGTISTYVDLGSIQFKAGQ